MAGRPLVIAHRGFSARYPENTLAAAQAAIQAGADFIEVDVQETSDGEIVVFHDLELRRLCGVKGRISEISYSKLVQRKPDVPLLSELLESVRGLCPLLIEMKRVNAGKVAQIIETARMTEEVIVFAFSIPLLQQVTQISPRIRRFGLVGDQLTETIRTIQSAVDIEGIGVANRLIRTKADVRRLRNRVGEVFVWTVNRASRMEELADWGVDGIITNHPDRALQIRKQNPARG